MAFKENMGGVKPTDVGTSAKVHMGDMGGNRPNQSKMAIETSAPKNPHTLGRDPGGSLR